MIVIAYLKRRKQLSLMLAAPVERCPEPPDALRLSDRLGRAGYITKASRRRFVRSFAISSMLLIACTGAIGASVGAKGIAFALAGYGAPAGTLLFLNRRTRQLEAALLYELPLVLESLILLVESGNSLFSAVEELTDSPPSTLGRRYLTSLFRNAKHRSAGGMPFSDNLRALSSELPFPTAQHVLFHLDIGLAEGGSVASGLRALADYCHTEWELSVATRENA